MTPLSLSLNGKLRMLKRRRPTNRNRVQRNYEKRRSSIENGPQPSGLGDGRLKRVVRVIACSRQLRFRRSIIFVEFAGVHDTLLVLRKIRR